MTWPAREPADMLARLGRHWGWVFAYGVLTLLAGIFALAWPGVVVLASPGLSLFGLAVILGVWLLILGGMEIGAAVRLRALTRR